MNQPGKPFTPPTADQLADHLAANAYEPPSPWATRAPMFVLLGLAAVVFLTNNTVAMTLMWIALIVMVGTNQAKLAAQRNLEKRVNRVQELAMLRRYPEALRQGWRLIPAIRQHGAMHGRTVAAMAQSLDETGQHEAALVSFDHLLEGLPKNHPGALHLQLRKAIASLCVDHLTDADEILRKMRRTLPLKETTPLTALYRFAQLLQDTRTAHFADALDDIPQTAAAIKPLGMEAGYGHALMALCHHHAPEGDPAAAEQCWKHATMLLPESSLVHRFPELAVLQDETIELEEVPRA